MATDSLQPEAAAAALPKIKAKAASAPRSRRRASQRTRGLELELGYPGKLRPLMIEHSRTEEGGYITVYAGVRGEFLSAGVPAHLIPTEGSVEFQISQRGNADLLLRATMSFIGGDRVELEIDWGGSMPYSCGHPAICELARMMLIDLGYWYQDHSLATPDFEQPIRGLLADERATFKPPKNAPRLQISADFHARLSEIARHAYAQVHKYGEVFPVPTHARKAEPEHKGSPVRLAIDNTR
jgi:hypothetical protein